MLQSNNGSNPNAKVWRKARRSENRYDNRLAWSKIGLECASGQTGRAHSRDGDQVFQTMVITDSGDRDQVQRRTRLTGLCVLEMTSWSRLAGWFEDRPGGPWEGPVRGAECPHERRSAARGRGLWAGGAIVREVLTVFSFRQPDAVDCRL